jgi:hypothetical protein
MASVPTVMTLTARTGSSVAAGLEQALKVKTTAHKIAPDIRDGNGIEMGWG